MSKITPCLWFDGNGLEAAEFYASVFPDSRIDKVHKAATETPGNKVGDVLFIELTLAGQSYQILNSGRYDAFNDAISLSVSCEDQAEVDRLWDALTADGGRPVACGWLKDKYGLSWQVAPRKFMDWLKDKDTRKVDRFMAAMMKMRKMDMAKLEAAYRGKPSAKGRA